MPDDFTRQRESSLREIQDYFFPMMFTATIIDLTHSPVSFDLNANRSCLPRMNYVIGKADAT